MTVRVWPMRQARSRGLVLDRGVPPAVVEHHVARRGEVQAGAAGLERQHQRARALTRLEAFDHRVAARARQAAVVAVDRRAHALGEVLARAAGPMWRSG